MESLFVTLPLFSIINFLAIITVLYTSINPYLSNFLPWMTFLVFVGIVCGLGMLGMVFVYIFVLPSIWTFRGKQMFEYESEVVKKINALQAMLENRGDEESKDKVPSVRVAVSGGFDPLHRGHAKYIREAQKLGTHLIVILSRDVQLDKKKAAIGGHLQDYEERKDMLVWALEGKGSFEVVENIDKDITSVESLRLYKPAIFAKGGDTWAEDNLPEAKVCEELGITVVFGVGGFQKTQSSSRLAERMRVGGEGKISG